MRWGLSRLPPLLRFVGLSGAAFFSEDAPAGLRVLDTLHPFDFAALATIAQIAAAPSATTAWSGPECLAISDDWLSVTTEGQDYDLNQRFNDWFSDHNELAFKIN